MSPRRAGARVLAALGSFHLAVAVLGALAAVVLVGTLEQRRMSLYDVQRTYFEAWAFTVPLLGVPVPMPGGALLLSLLGVNLLVGGVLRLRRHRSTVGVLVTHLGVAGLLVGSAVEHVGSDKGVVVLLEGERATRFEAYTTWELAVVDVARGREHVVGPEALEAAARRPRTFRHPDLPFELVVSGFLRNSDVRRAPAGTGVEGVELVPQPPDPRQAEREVAGAYVEVATADGRPPVRGIVWGRADAPFSAEVAGRGWAFELRREGFPLPFALRLDRAEVVEHPGTDLPKAYASWVTRERDGRALAAHVTMNAPLRADGYTFYQSSFARGADGRASVGFAVVRNPSDRVPAVACAVIGVGMVLHFLRRLARHLRAGSPPAAGPAAGAPVPGSAP